MTNVTFIIKRYLILLYQKARHQMSANVTGSIEIQDLDFTAWDDGDLTIYQYQGGDILLDKVEVERLFNFLKENFKLE